MTPMDTARTVYRDNYGNRQVDTLEVAITAYLTALSEDAGTVEKVATAIELCEHPHSSEHVARAALTALASRDGEKS